MPDDENRLEFACRCLLVQDLDGKTVLFETGIGAFFEPKLRARYGVHENEHVLLRSLARARRPARGRRRRRAEPSAFRSRRRLAERVRASRAPPELLFPRARYIVSKAAWARACAPHPRDRASYVPDLPALLRKSGRLEILDRPQSTLLGAAVRFDFSDGHTPGLALAEIGGEGGVAFCSDLIPGRPWVHLPVTMGYDRYPELLIDEKQRFLEDKIARRVRLFFTHDLECAAALPVRGEDGRFGVTAEQGALEGEQLQGEAL